MFKINTKKLKILTPNGLETFFGIKRSGPYKIYEVTTERGRIIRVTKDHLFFLEDDKTIVASQSEGHFIQTVEGLERVIQIIPKSDGEYVYDLVGVPSKCYFTNGVLSHNCNILEEFWSAVIPSISSSKKSKLFMVSTPSGTENKFYEIHTKAEEDPVKSGWKAVRIDWYDVPGRDNEWYKKTLEDLGGDEKLFAQEFGCQFLDKNETAIGLQILQEYRRAAKNPIWTSADGDYKVFEYPDPSHLYVVGVDVGEGIGGAATCSQVIDITDLTNIQQVAVHTSNVLEPNHYAQLLKVLLDSWGRPPAMIERNNCGGQLIDALYYNHSYDKIIPYAGSRKMNIGKTSGLGILSHTNTRFHGVQNLRYFMNALKVVQIHDLATIGELETFVKYPNDVYKKQSGARDDRVLALIWALFILDPDITSAYFEVDQWDNNNKPLKLSPLDGVHETIPDFYQVRDLQHNATVHLTPNWALEEVRLEKKTEIRQYYEELENQLEAALETEEDYAAAGWQIL